GLLGAQELPQRLRADQAADMGGEDTIGAALHSLAVRTSKDGRVGPGEDIELDTCSATKTTARVGDHPTRAAKQNECVFRSSGAEDRAPDHRGRPAWAWASSATGPRAACACGRACAPGGL